MSGNGYVIDNRGLLVALLMVAVAALVSELMCISIGKTLMWSAIRALVQLCVMGVIIGYVIRSNNPWLVFGVIALPRQGHPEGARRPGTAQSGHNHAADDLAGDRAGGAPAPLVCTAAGGAAYRHAAGQHRVGARRRPEPVL